MRARLRTFVALALGAAVPFAAAAALPDALLPPAVAQPAPAAPPAKPAQPAKPADTAPPIRIAIPFEKYALENGLEVILHEDHRTPVVAVNVWYHVGSKDEPQGKNGFAHLFEHVMFQGSKNVGEDMYFKYLERAGASDRNGTTSLDRTNYYETVPSNELELVLWLESDRMGFLLDHANDATFKSQREVVKNERRQNYENAPYGLVGQFIRSAVYPEGHPYRLLTIGTPEDLDAASFADVTAFFKTFYVPNNATLVVAGDINPARARELVKKYFGPLARGADPPVKKAPMPVALEKEKLLEVEAEVELPRLQITWATPQHFAPGDVELDFVASVMSVGKSSRLYKRLVYDLQIAQDVSASQSSSQLASLFEIIVTLKKGKSPADARRIVDEELKKLAQKAPTDEEIGRARTGILSRMIFAMERVTARADQLNFYNQLTGDPGFLSKDVERYERVSPADVQKAAASLLPLGKRVVTIVTPTKGAPRAGRLVRSN
jgi:predicted Zn-dependent peptidase